MPDARNWPLSAKNLMTVRQAMCGDRRSAARNLFMARNYINSPRRRQMGDRGRAVKNYSSMFISGFHATSK